MQFIDLAAQQRRIRKQLDQRVNAVLEHGVYIMGPEVREIEDRLAEFAGVKHCISVANGTDALQVALMALGVGPGDEVITSPFTFIATGETIALLGAVPVFVDIDPVTYNMDPDKIEQAITNKTRAIMPVSLYGQCADFDKINSVASKHGIPVIEDGAQSFGATYKGRRSCSLSTIGCTSFFPSKPLGCYGDGGALFTDDDDIASRMSQIRLHGQDRRYHHPLIGVNSRLDTLQAAVLLAKLDVFEDELAARQIAADRYAALLAGTGVRLPTILRDNTSAFAQYTIEVDDRDHFVQTLAESDVPTAVHYPVPLNLQPAFAYLQLQKGAFPLSESAAERVVSLPMHPYLTEEDQKKVIEAVKTAL